MNTSAKAGLGGELKEGEWERKPSRSPPSDNDSNSPLARKRIAGGCPALEYSTSPVIGSSLARNMLAKGTAEVIRQMSWFTPATIDSGWEVAAVGAPTSPTKWVVHIPAARP